MILGVRIARRTTLEAGRALDAPVLRQAMTGAFGASDSDGAWVWKDAYEAAEAALVLFIQRYGCCSARSLDADRRGKVLIRSDSGGSNDAAELEWAPGSDRWLEMI